MPRVTRDGFVLQGTTKLVRVWLLRIFLQDDLQTQATARYPIWGRSLIKNFGHVTWLIYRTEFSSSVSNKSTSSRPPPWQWWTPSWTLHGHRHLYNRSTRSRPNNNNVRAPSWSPPDHGHLTRLCSLVHLVEITSHLYRRYTCSLAKLTYCFPRHSEAERMLRTHLG